MNHLQRSNPYRSRSGNRASGTYPLLGLLMALAAMLLAGLGAANAAGPQAGGNNVQFAPGRVLVAPQVGSSDADFHTALGNGGGRSLGRIHGIDVHMVDVAPGGEQDAVERLAHNPHVRFAELDQLVAPGSTANDPYFNSEWHLSKINATTAWDSSTGTGVTIAILDTGVDATHPDLAAQMVSGWNFYDNNSNTADVHGHGTAVAGAAAAASNNLTGVASVAGGARIMPIRIADANAYAYWSTVAQGVNWAADHGARVANISYQGVAGSSTVQSAASYFRSKGGVVVVCAGNAGTLDSTAPNSVMTVVSATDQNDLLTSFSSYGSFVNLSAPGINILTTSRGGGYQYWWGTSFASPIAAGAAALVLAVKPTLTPTQVDSILRTSATDLGAAGTDIYYGAGRVNAAAAVQQALAASASDTTPPAVAIASPTGGAVSAWVTVSVNATDNVGVTRVDLRVNGQTVASDTSTPFQFSWDSTKVANGSVTLTAAAYDAAGNSSVSAGVSVLVSNAVAADTTPPSLAINNPLNGSVVSGNVRITTTASDNSGSTGITQLLYIDGVLTTTVIGAPLSYNWNTRKAAAGAHLISVTARDAAGNTTSKQVQVTK